MMRVAKIFGLKQNDIEAIVKVLQGFPVIETALIFGSRAMGNYKRGSDIDIAIKGEDVTFNISSKISYLLNEETPMPYFFDVVHYEQIANDNLIDHINRVGVVFYTKSTFSNA